MIDALQKTLETLRGTIDGEIKAIASQRFMAYIQLTGQRPDSFKAVDGGATATLTLARKASTTALSDAAVTLLRENGLEPEKLVITPQLFAINPEYAQNTELLGKVEKALKKIVPDDFILVQHEKSKLVATEATLLAAVGKRAPAEVIQSITSISCAPKLQNTNMSRILDFVRGLIDAPIFGTAANDASLTQVKAAAEPSMEQALEASLKQVRARKVASK